MIVAALLPLTYLALHKIGGWNGMQDAMDKRRKAARPSRGPAPI